MCECDAGDSLDVLAAMLAPVTPPGEGDEGAAAAEPVSTWYMMEARCGCDDLRRDADGDVAIGVESSADAERGKSFQCAVSPAADAAEAGRSALADVAIVSDEWRARSAGAYAGAAPRPSPGCAEGATRAAGRRAVLAAAAASSGGWYMLGVRAWAVEGVRAWTGAR